MKMQANIALNKNEYVAELSDGRRIAQANLKDFACDLVSAGVMVTDAQYEWRAGHRLLTAGQQLALRAEMRRVGRSSGATDLAA